MLIKLTIALVISFLPLTAFAQGVTVSCDAILSISAQLNQKHLQGELGYVASGKGVKFLGDEEMNRFLLDVSKRMNCTIRNTSAPTEFLCVAKEGDITYTMNVEGEAIIVDGQVIAVDIQNHPVWVTIEQQ